MERIEIEDGWIIDGEKYVVVCSQGIIFRIRKKRIGLVRVIGVSYQ